MKQLIRNQKLRIDSHTRGEPTPDDLKGIHIHKTFVDGRFKKKWVKIYINGGKIEFDKKLYGIKVQVFAIVVYLTLWIWIFSDAITAIHEGYAEELNHLSKALMSDSELWKMRCEGRLYGSIMAEFRCRGIEIGMTAKSFEERFLKLASRDPEEI